MSTVREQAADLLDATADELLIHGHTKNALRRKTGAMCVMGAMRHVTFGKVYPRHLSRVNVNDSGGNDVMRLATRVLSMQVHSGDVASWNDAAETTEDDVHDALRTTAKKLREDLHAH